MACNVGSIPRDGFSIGTHLINEVPGTNCQVEYQGSTKQRVSITSHKNGVAKYIHLHASCSPGDLIIQEEIIDNVISFPGVEVERDFSLDQTSGSASQPQETIQIDIWYTNTRVSTQQDTDDFLQELSNGPGTKWGTLYSSVVLTQ